jgi:hypothetical protein
MQVSSRLHGATFIFASKQNSVKWALVGQKFHYFCLNETCEKKRNMKRKTKKQNKKIGSKKLLLFFRLEAKRENIK